MGAPRLVLDFDGVICDALAECALVTWLGVHLPAPTSAVSSYMAALPRGFTDRFRRVRAYARTLDHFLVAHRPSAARIRTRSRFEMLFNCFAPPYVAAFAAAATAARTRCRSEEERYWLGLHALYPGLPEVLRQNAGAVTIVTAKDDRSVRTILAHHGLGDTVGDVVGECRDKAAALAELCRRHRVRPAAVTFVDDSVANVRAVASTGADCRWASWGYHTAEDLQDVTRLRIRRLELRELPSVTA